MRNFNLFRWCRPAEAEPEQSPIQEPAEDEPPEPRQEEARMHPSSFSSLPMAIEAITIEDLMENASFKDAFQLLFNGDKSRLYVLLRDTAGAEQQIEGRVPVVILDENRVVQLSLLLRDALTQMRRLPPRFPHQPLATDVTNVSGAVTPMATPSWFEVPETPGLFLENLPFPDEEREDGDEDEEED
jgi:hypothetical protein